MRLPEPACDEVVEVDDGFGRQIGEEALSVPNAVVTSRSTVPAASPAGETAVMRFGTTEKVCAGRPPNLTALTPQNRHGPVKFVPLIRTCVPPATGPDAGLRAVICGGAASGNGRWSPGPSTRLTRSSP